MAVTWGLRKSNGELIGNRSNNFKRKFWFSGVWMPNKLILVLDQIKGGVKRGGKLVSATGDGPILTGL